MDIMTTLKNLPQKASHSRAPLANLANASSVFITKIME